MEYNKNRIYLEKEKYFITTEDFLEIVDGKCVSQAESSSVQCFIAGISSSSKKFSTEHPRYSLPIAAL